MPASVVRTAEDERRWRLAKQQAAKQGRGKDYRYIMGIFQQMSGEKSLQSRLQDLIKARVSVLPTQTTLFGVPGQATLFGDAPRKKAGKDKPPPGYQPVKGSKKGGYFRMVGGKRVYWYPGGKPSASKQQAKPATKPEAPAKPKTTRSYDVFDLEQTEQFRSIDLHRMEQKKLLGKVKTHTGAQEAAEAHGKAIDARQGVLSLLHQGASDKELSAAKKVADRLGEQARETAWSVEEKPKPKPKPNYEIGLQNEARRIDRHLEQKKRMLQYAGQHPGYQEAADAHEKAAYARGDIRTMMRQGAPENEISAAKENARQLSRKADRLTEQVQSAWKPAAALSGWWQELLTAAKGGDVVATFRAMAGAGEWNAVAQAKERLREWSRKGSDEHGHEYIHVTASQREQIEKLKKPEPKKSPVDKVIDLAAQMGIPAEPAGPRSVALGGAASFDRDLGKWNGRRGSEARRIASTAKAQKWLEQNREKVGQKQSFREQMDDRRRQGLFLTGNTYPYKEEIKKAGGVWDRYEKRWLMPDRESIEKMQALMRGGARKEQRSPQRSTSSSPTATPKQVGYAMSLINRIVSEDIGTATTYGYQSVRRKDLEGMSRRDVSGIIDHLRSELY